jgi:hypothetical protein
MLDVCYCYIIAFSFSLIRQIGNVFVQLFENAENLLQKGFRFLFDIQKSDRTI